MHIAACRLAFRCNGGVLGSPHESQLRAHPSQRTGAILGRDKDEMTLRNYGDERGTVGGRANKSVPDTKQAAWARWGSERNDGRCMTRSWSRSRTLQLDARPTDMLTACSG